MDRDEEAAYYMFCGGAVITIIGLILATCLEVNAYVNKSRSPIARNTVISLLSVGIGATATGVTFGLIESNKTDIEINADLQLLLSKKKACPKMCQGCKYYCGEYGVNCALHPNGAEDSFCVDWTP